MPAKALRIVLQIHPSNALIIDRLPAGRRGDELHGFGTPKASKQAGGRGFEGKGRNRLDKDFDARAIAISEHLLREQDACYS